MKFGKQLKYLTIIFFTNLFLSIFFLINISYAQIPVCADNTSNTVNCTGPLTITRGGETITNSGTITVSTSGNDDDALGINSEGDGNTITNSGTITVLTSGDDAYAYGIFSEGDGNTITNSGTITATSTGEDGANAYGIRSIGDDNIITNSGTITATSTGLEDLGIFSEGDGNTITNSGTITLSTSEDNADAYGIRSIGDDDNIITNSGTITVSTSGVNAYAYGIKSNGDSNTITNSGSITATSHTTMTYGIYFDGVGNTITNSGSIAAESYDDATGIRSNGVGNTITNSGSITAIVTSEYYYAYGIKSDNYNTIANSGSIEIRARADAYGISSINSSGRNNTITNSGSITATSTGFFGSAYGIDSRNHNTITNSGSITATSTTLYAYGIRSNNDNTIINSGSITATSTGEDAYGIRSNNDNTITNSGTITATSAGVDAYGIFTTRSNNIITNSGTITATSTVGHSNGIFSYGDDNTITNSGKIIAEFAIRFDETRTGNILNIQPNSYIDGTILVSGATVNITTGPSHSIYYNLGVTPTFSGPTPGFIKGTRAATFDPTVFKGSINELADLNNNISLTASKNLSNFKDRQFSTSVFASQLEHKADAVNLKQEIDQLGVVFAYDYKLADTNLNFIAGYANSDLEANSRFAKSYNNKSKGPFIGVAGIYDAGLVNVNFGLTTGRLKHSHDRFVNDNEETNGEDHAKANYDSMFIAPEIGVSKKFKSNDIIFSRKANVRYNYQSVDGYTEKGSNSNAKVKSLDVGLVETNLEVAGTKSFNKSSYTIKTGYLNRQSVGDHKATVTMIDQTNSIGFGDKSNNIYYVGVGADLNLANFKLSFDLNQYLGDTEGVQGMVKLSSSF